MANMLDETTRLVNTDGRDTYFLINTNGCASITICISVFSMIDYIY